MLEDRLQPMEESYKTGFQLLKRRNYDAAITFFRQKLEEGTPQAHALAHYGLATAIYQQKQNTLTREEVREIISHYETSISQDPDFADAYVLCSVAYDRLAMTFIEQGKTDASLRTTVLANARKALTTARNHLAKALELNLKLANTAAQYLASYNSTENTILAVEKFKD